MNIYIKLYEMRFYGKKKSENSDYFLKSTSVVHRVYLSRALKDIFQRGSCFLKLRVRMQ